MTKNKASLGDLTPSALDALILSNARWYHTIELPFGRTTPGVVDLREAAGRVLPKSLEGLRALDVATFDGFWALELEARGAEEVVALDLPQLEDADWSPPRRQGLEQQMADLDLQLGRGFEIATRARNSGVRRVECNVYDLDAEILGEAVDFAFVGALLLHLRDPVAALERVREVLRPAGRICLFEPISASMSLWSPSRPAARFRPLESNFTWWDPNRAALVSWLRTAGFVNVHVEALMRPPSREGRQLCAAVHGEKPIVPRFEAPPGNRARRLVNRARKRFSSPLLSSLRP